MYRHAVWWPFRKRSSKRLEAVPDPDDTEGDTLDDVVEDLRRKVNALRYDVDDLTERFQRRAGRENKAASRATAPADGAGPVAPRRNGLPTLAQLRAAGRSPFGGQ